MWQMIRHPHHTILEISMLEISLILLDEESSDNEKVSHAKDKILEALREMVTAKDTQRQ